jgi:hypothetical protein
MKKEIAGKEIIKWIKTHIEANFFLSFLRALRGKIRIPVVGNFGLTRKKLYAMLAGYLSGSGS